MLPYHPHPYPLSAQTTPSSYPSYSARSPTSTISDPVYGSPTQYPYPMAYYTDRRTSTIIGNVPHPPSLPSASSSADSYGAASSSADGYSTAHTTPLESGSAIDGTARPILPPPLGMHQNVVTLSSGFTCDYEGCNAAPFQTQYLLRFVFHHNEQR